MSILKQASFSGGELAPSLQARVDLVKYQTGARTLRNTMVLKSGGTANRAGTDFVADFAGFIRLIDYVISPEESHVLAFSQLELRILQNSDLIVQASTTITGITQAAQGVVTTSGAHGLTTGQQVLLSSIIGMDQLNGRYLYADVLTGTTFKLKDLLGAYVDTTGFGAYSSGGTVARVYVLTSPYTSAELPDVRYVQNAESMTLVHPSHVPYELIKISSTSWTLAARATAGGVPPPAITGCVAATPGAISSAYLVTTIDPDTGEESVTSYSSAGFAISSVTAANPIVVTTTLAHGLAPFDIVRILGTGMGEINDREFQVLATPSVTTFTLKGEVGTTYTAAGAGGLVYRIGCFTLTAAVSAVNTVTIDWAQVDKFGRAISEYAVYKRDPSGRVYGLLGYASTNTFVDIGQEIDLSILAPVPRNPFAPPGAQPGAITYFQQRLIMGGSDNAPETIEASRIQSPANFAFPTPVTADSAISFDMSGRQLNQVKHLMDLGGLIIFTTAGEWVAKGDPSGVLTPTDINLKQVSYNGSGGIHPLAANNTALYVQARGSVVRDLSYDYQADGYNGNDLTVFAGHLFEGHTIVSWAYQQVPNSTVWAVRDDGVLLALTYLKEHQIVAWHRHDFTSGTVENVCVVPEVSEDAVYLSVRVGSARHITRMKSRAIDDIVDSVFMDSAVTYDGRNTNTSFTLTLSAGGAGQAINLTASGAFFAAADVGKTFILTGSDGEVIRFIMDSKTSPTIAVGRVNRTIPASLSAVAVSTWARAISTVNELWHLEGRRVSVLGDGLVVASPYNSSFETPLTVSQGQVTLPNAYAVVHVGLPYLSDLETLNLDTAGGGTYSDKKMIVNKVNIQLEKTRGVWIGAKPPTDDSDNALEGLDELKIRNEEDYDDPVDLFTGTESVVIKSEWNSNGRVFIRQVDPVPISVLAVVPSVTVASGGG